MSVTIRGMTEVQAKLRKLEAELSTSGMVSTVDRAAKYVHSQVPAYPAASPSSRYRRTGTLGREIYDRVRSIGSSIVGVIGSPTVYALHVIWRATQAWMHRGRWWTLQDVLEKSRDGVIRIFEDDIRRLIR
jgi:hypothetical protein